MMFTLLASYQFFITARTIAIGWQAMAAKYCDTDSTTIVC